MADPIAARPAAPAAALNPQQTKALANLHTAATRFESFFVNMLFKTMREASPATSITGGKPSNAQTTFSEMLDTKRSDAIAQTGAFGIAKILEDQLRGAVIADPRGAAAARIAPEGAS